MTLAVIVGFSLDKAPKGIAIMATPFSILQQIPALKIQGSYLEEMPSALRISLSTA
jgi:hypothetical protein